MQFWLAAERVYNPGPIAASYAEIASTLAGFAVAGLIVYMGLEHQRRPSALAEPATGGPAPTTPTPTNTGTEPQSTWTKLVDDVTAAIFYAMASLAICAFLYAGISGDSDSSESRRGATLMVWYAVVLSLSVLALFYSLTLMMLERRVTRPAAKYAYLVLVVAGPVVVMRFIASLEFTAWQLSCDDGSCHEWIRLNPAGFGMVLLFMLLGLSLLAATAKGMSWLRRSSHDTEPERPGPKWLLWRLDDRPSWPAGGVFWLTILVAVVSLPIGARPPSFLLSSNASFLFLLVGFVLLLGFSFTCIAALHRRVRSVDDKPA